MDAARQRLARSDDGARTDQAESAFRSLARFARQAWAHLWRAVQSHVADLHGIPRAERDP